MASTAGSFTTTRIKSYLLFVSNSLYQHGFTTGSSEQTESEWRSPSLFEMSPPDGKYAEGRRSCGMTSLG